MNQGKFKVLMDLDLFRELLGQEDSTSVAKRISLLAGNSPPTYLKGKYAITLKPYLGFFYESLNNYGQREMLIYAWYRLISRLDNISENELHFERFKNGHLHGHGILDVGDRELTEIEMQNIYKTVHSIIGKRGESMKLCVTIKKIDNMEKWLEYINKENALDPYVYKGQRIEYSNVKKKLQGFMREQTDEFVEAAHLEYIKRTNAKLKGKLF